MTTDDIMALANKYAASNGKALLEKLYGTTRSYTEQCTAEAFQDRQALRAAIEKAAAELRRLHDENEALKADLETERIRLAACSTAALGYFNGCTDEYKSASLDDVLKLRADVEALRKALRNLFGYANRLEMNDASADGEHPTMQDARAAMKGQP